MRFPIERQIVFLFTMLLLLPYTRARANEFDEVTDIIPSSANALVIVDFSALANSEWAIKNDLQIGDVLYGSPELQRIVVASEVDFEYMVPLNQIAFAKFATKSSFDSFASANEGRVISIADKQVVWLPHRTAVTTLDNETFLILPHHSRQNATRYIRNYVTEPNADRASIFLKYATDQISDRENNVAAFAMDLRDTIGRTAIDRVVQKSEVFPIKLRADVAKLMTGLEGIVLTVNAGEDLRASIQLRFQDDAMLLTGRGVEFIDSIMRNLGVGQGEIAQWQEKIDGQTVVIHGPINERALEEFLSLAFLDVAVPRSIRDLASNLKQIEIANAPPQEQTEDKRDTQPQIEREPVAPVVDATKDYLNRLRRMMIGLNRRTLVQPLQSRYWLDRYAFKIQYINRENVDPKLLEFADELTGKLHAMADQLEGALVASLDEFDPVRVAVPSWNTINYGGYFIRPRVWTYGGYGYENDPEFVDRAKAGVTINDAIVKVKSQGIEIVREFNDLGSKLAEEHGFEFERWNAAEIK
jgi:hypothetical protein